ncbi:MAG: PEP-CTERM sorting domain-containing protein [Puniceicoccaceae bacterium]|nr:PEP-CTERM sorting domain-containing protein [Puniceicoccaceae bacterium]
MKKVHLLVSFAAIAVLSSSYGSFIASYSNVNGTWYDLNAASSNADFQSSDLGTFDINSDQLLLGAEMNINGDNVYFSRIGWAVFDSGGSIIGSFVETAGTFDSAPGGNDRWVVSGVDRPDVLSGLTGSVGGTDYTLRVYLHGDYNPSGFDFYESNNSANYIANFSVVPEPGTYALLAGLLGFAYAAIRRRAQ